MTDHHHCRRSGGHFWGTAEPGEHFICAKCGAESATRNTHGRGCACWRCDRRAHVGWGLTEADEEPHDDE